MRKTIAAINMTLDGYGDHTAISPDEEVHQHYADLIGDAGVLLYGRITFQLMEFWKTLVKDPSGEKEMDDFALAMDKVPKIVFSHTLTETGWHNAKLADQSLEKTVSALKQQTGKDIYVGSKSLIIQLMNLHLLDELQLCVHPVLVGSGRPLFENIEGRSTLNLVRTKTFRGGAIILYYKPISEKATNP